MDLRPILFVIGILLSILSLSMVIPMLADLYFGYSDWRVFFICIIITSFFGGSLILSNAGQTFHMNVRQAFLLTVLSWVSMALFGSLPFVLSELKMSFTDSFFESMSGITTTGFTVITGLDDAPAGILLWRSLLQWLGGIGFVVMALSMLPFLKVGGMQLFKTESSEREKAVPRAAQLARALAGVYVALTFVCAVFFMATGMGAFDAAAHAMSTIATGGFSTNDSSFMKYDAPWTEIVAMTFMFLGGLPFVMYVKALGGNVKIFFHDSQVRCYAMLVVAATSTLVVYLVFFEQVAFLTALRGASFNVISIMTSTGFSNADINTWGSFSAAFLIFLAFVGACSGSTAGGIKVFRFQILWQIVSLQVKKLLHPHGVFVANYNGKPVPRDVPMAVMGFFFVYLLTFVVSCTALSFFNLDLLTAMSIAVAGIGNVGMANGDLVGPMGSFKVLPDGAKWITSITMLMGRLELFTVLVLLSRHFWKP